MKKQKLRHIDVKKKQLEKELPRQAKASVAYQQAKKAGGAGKRPAAVLAEYNEGFTYTDPASGESDTISITLTNADLRWANKWTPKRGDKLTAKIIERSWGKAGKKKTFYCGKFCLDDLSYTGPELTCTIGGVSVPEGNSFRSTGRSKTWKKATLKEVAEEIAKKYRLRLQYNGGSVKLGTIEQSNEPDSGFLTKVCGDYGMAIKIYSGKIVIYDKGEFEARKPVATLKKADLQDWSYNSTLVGTYTGARIKYTSGKDDKEMECVVGRGKRMLNINEKVESLQEAQIKACAKVNAENEKAETMSATIMADNRIAAGSTVKIKGLCQLSGKYFVDKATHNINPDGAYTMALELHKCQKRITDATVMKEWQGEKKTVAGKQENRHPESGGEFTEGDKVIVNGPAYWGGNGGKANQCSNMTMYITQILGSGYKYQYGVAKRKGGTRYGWCQKESLKKA